jgi:hypothetical protein
MNGNVFECFDEQKDRKQFNKTREALGEYAKKHLKFAEDLAPLFAETIAAPTAMEPQELTPNATQLQTLIWNEEVKVYVKRSREMRSNLAALYAVAWGQCSEAMKSKLKSTEGHATARDANDCEWLLRSIRSITLQFDSTRNIFLSLVTARASFYTYRQEPGQTVDSYINGLRGWAETIESYGGTISESFELIPETDDDGEERDQAARQALARAKTLGICAIRGADPQRYGSLITELANQHAMGHDNYPSDLTAAYGLLVNYQTPRNSGPARVPQAQGPAAPDPTPSEGLMFAQTTQVAGNNGVVHDGITCFRCQASGHYASNCPREPNNSGDVALMQFGTSFTQTANSIPHTWILLDSQSTVSVFNNPSMLSDIKPTHQTLRVRTNGGHQDSHMQGIFRNLGWVWFNPSSIANILSLAQVRRVCRVTLDTADVPALHVHRLDGSIMVFTEHPSGLYVFDTSAARAPSTPIPVSFLTTVADNRSMFTPRQLQDADTARALYRKIGRPSEAAFLHILRHNLIRNCPVTVEDAQRATLIYGPDLATLKGKTTRRAAAPHVPTFSPEPVPRHVLAHHSDVTLCMDFLYVQGMCFLHSISRTIAFRTLSHVTSRGKRTILDEFRRILRLYQPRGFRVRDVHADNEFECIRDDIRPIELDIVPADSHVGEVERSVRTLKERTRCTVHGLPYKRLPKLMVREILKKELACLNMFPQPGSIAGNVSPNTIVTGKGLPDYNQMTIEFGAYAQVFEDNDPTNTTKARTVGAIALTRTGNANGDYYFMSLATGARLSRHAWTELPITDDAIARVEALAAAEGQPLIQEQGLVMEWRPGYTVTEDDYDWDYAPPQDGGHDEGYDEEMYEPIDDDELADLQGDDHQHHDAFDHVPLDYHEDDPDAPDEGAQEEGALEEGALEEGAPDEAAPEEDEGAPEEDEGAPDEGPPEPETVLEQGAGQEAPPAARYNLRERTTGRTGFAHAIDDPHSSKSYLPPHQFVQQHQCGGKDDCEDTMSTERFIFGFIMTQMSAKAGIKKHGRAAEEALLAEFAQLEELNVFEAIDPSTLTKDQRVGALRAINLIKEKRTGKLKGRTVADGRPQRALYDKSQTASPTVSSDALMISLMIDAKERRDVAIADVAGAYLKADMDDFVVMKLIGDDVRIFCEMNPDYEKYVVDERGQRALYVRLLKALYGCVKSALLWYRLFSEHLQGMGFVLNPYDPCVANCIIDGKQCTIVWFVDDNKISHVNPVVVTKIVGLIEERFGKMTVTRGKKHTFLGMEFEFTDDGTVRITMNQYLREALDESGMNVSRSAASPAKKDLFEVDETSARLDKRDSDLFHSVVAKLLYVSMRARPDLLLPVIFLCSRVAVATKEDMGKLRRLLEYVFGTMHLTYTLGADNLASFRTWVDASFAVHPDMRSHTGGLISFGTGGLVVRSSRQKLNTKSSTEAEFVGASDYLPNTLWTKMFLEAQGYQMRELILEQDNEAAMKLEVNGRASCSARTRHVAIRYFFVKDRIKQENIVVRHCPTLQMLADFFTKPLQGALFRKFRDVILGYTHVKTLVNDTVALTQERVGERAISDSDTSDSKKKNISGKAIERKHRVSWADVVAGNARQRCSVESVVANEREGGAHSLETIPLVK